MTAFFTRRFLPGPPWVHFLAMGLVLHLALAWAFPEPPPVLGPPSEARVELLADGFARMVGRLPSDEDRARFVDTVLREDLLFREALARDLQLADPAIEQRIIRNMRFLEPDTTETDAQLIERGFALNMHLTDEVIRRRLVQVMEQLLIASAKLPEMTEGELRDAYAARAETLTAPATVSFHHVFFGDIDAASARTRLGTIQASNMAPDQALELGVAFLAGFEFKDLTHTGVASRFGREFAAALEAQLETWNSTGQGEDLVSGQWVGPVTSVFGQHAVFVTHSSRARQLSFDEARKSLSWQLKSEREQAALDAAIAQLMLRYEVRRS